MKDVMETMETKKHWKDVRIIPADGKPRWSDGAYCLAFVYSNKGNFLVKGYLREVKKYLETLKQQGYKYFANLSMWGGMKRYRDMYLALAGMSNITTPFDGLKQHRSYWTFWKDKYYISEPSETNKGKWTFRKWDVNEHIIQFKRLPKKWIPELDNLN